MLRNLVKKSNLFTILPYGNMKVENEKYLTGIRPKVLITNTGNEMILSSIAVLVLDHIHVIAFRRSHVCL